MPKFRIRSLKKAPPPLSTLKYIAKRRQFLRYKINSSGIELKLSTSIMPYFRELVMNLLKVHLKYKAILKKPLEDSYIKQQLHKHNMEVALKELDAYKNKLYCFLLHYRKPKILNPIKTSILPKDFTAMEEVGFVYTVNINTRLRGQIYIPQAGSIQVLVHDHKEVYDCIGEVLLNMEKFKNNITLISITDEELHRKVKYPLIQELFTLLEGELTNNGKVKFYVPISSNI
jgi:hypothetical protein